MKLTLAPNESQRFRSELDNRGIVHTVEFGGTEDTIEFDANGFTVRNVSFANWRNAIDYAVRLTTRGVLYSHVIEWNSERNSHIDIVTYFEPKRTHACRVVGQCATYTETFESEESAKAFGKRLRESGEALDYRVSRIA